MNIPKADVELAFTYGFQFNVLQKNDRGKPWQTVFEDIPSLSEAMEKVTTIDAWETGVFTMEGTLYWSSHTPEVFNSTIIEQGKRVTVFLENFQLTWDAFIKAKTKQKAEKLLNQTKNKIGHPITIIMNERYWKDKSLYHVIFSCKISTNKIAEATFQTLQLNSKIASKWTISYPSQYDDNKWDFEGVAQNVLISGIELLSFSLHNYEKKYMKEDNDAS